jgi:hypothetical protein
MISEISRDFVFARTEGRYDVISSVRPALTPRYGIDPNEWISIPIVSVYLQVVQLLTLSIP